MKTTDITKLSTKELVAMYNEATGKSIKKFSSRAAGEKQVLAALKAKVEREAANTPAAKARKVHPRDMTVCPKCGSNELYAGRNVDGLVKDEDRCGGCHACDWSWGVGSSDKSANRSAAIARTWSDPEVKAARSQRTHVKVGTTVYRSVKEAFEQLGLPLSKHIRFRMQLKQHAQMTFNADGKKITFHVIQD